MTLLSLTNKSNLARDVLIFIRTLPWLDNVLISLLYMCFIKDGSTACVLQNLSYNHHFTSLAIQVLIMRLHATIDIQPCKVSTLGTDLVFTREERKSTHY